MDRKSLEKIKAPEEWIEEALRPKKNKFLISERSRMRKFRTVAAAAAAVVFLCGTFVTVAAKTPVFQSLLENIFGSENVTEVGLDTEEKEQTAPEAEKKELMELEENMMVVGETESFISEYHMVGDNEAVDAVFTVVSDTLKKMTPEVFEIAWEDRKIGFEYVISGNEIYAFNYTGGISEVFPYCKDGVVYGVCDIKETKAYLLEIHLEEKRVEKISGDNMMCNFAMSPQGTKILCNHRGDGYWSVFDITTRKETKISTKLLDGYIRPKEIEFLDENRILTYGESIFRNNTEIPCTISLNLETMQIEEKYWDVGLINMRWSYEYRAKKKLLRFYEITGDCSFTIPDVEGCGQILARSGDYVLFGDLEEVGSAIYLIRLSQGTWKKMEIPGELWEDLDIHLIKTQKKILITNQQKVYLADVSSL